MTALIGAALGLLNRVIDRIWPEADEWNAKDRVKTIKKSRKLRKRMREWLKDQETKSNGVS